MKLEEEIKNFKIILLRKLPFYGDIVLKLCYSYKKVA